MSPVDVRLPVGCFATEVARVRRLSPSFVRITLGGAALAGFDDGGDLGPRDLRVKLVVPRAGGTVAPVEDLSPGWYPRWLARDPLLRGELRTYTVRAARTAAARPEIDLDVVLHDPAGPASAWAASARAGDPLWVLGPTRGCLQEYGGIEWSPPDGPGPLLLAGDETAVPAVASVLATLPAGRRVHAVLEVPVCGDFLDLARGPDVEVTWLARGTRPVGELLVPRVRALPRPAYAWVAGEAGLVRAVRRGLLAGGTARDRVTFMGYWRVGAAQ